MATADASGDGSGPAGVCRQCGHAFDPHVLLATNGEPVDGGVVLCPVVGCLGFSTWGMNGLPAVRVPDETEIAALRAHVQRG